MTLEYLISLLHQDIANERKHMLFYLQASTAVVGLHREEYREFFLEEAQSELLHVQQFADAIHYLNGSLNHTIATGWQIDKTDPISLLQKALSMEEEVSANYTLRLKEISMDSPAEAWIHLFYEDQLQDSWKTAKEITKMIG